MRTPRDHPDTGSDDLIQGRPRQGMLLLQVPERQGQHGGIPRGCAARRRTIPAAPRRVKAWRGRGTPKLSGPKARHHAASVAVDKNLRPVRRMPHQPAGRSDRPSRAGNGDGISILMAHLRHPLAYPRDGFAIWFPSGRVTELVRSPAQRPVQPEQPCPHPKMKQDIR